MTASNEGSGGTSSKVVVNEGPPSLDEVKAAVVAHHQRVTNELAAKRQTRDLLNAEIRRLVAEEAEAARMVKALTPRKRGAT